MFRPRYFKGAVGVDGETKERKWDAGPVVARSSVRKHVVHPMRIEDEAWEKYVLEVGA